MWGLIIYVVLVVVGALISAGTGYYVEQAHSQALSLIVFLSLFFANFIVSWFVTVFIVERVLRPQTAPTGAR